MKKSILLAAVLLGSIRVNASAAEVARVECHGGEENALTVILERKDVVRAGYIFQLVLGKNGQFVGRYESIGTPISWGFGGGDHIYGFVFEKTRERLGDNESTREGMAMIQNRSFLVIIDTQDPERGKIGIGKFLQHEDLQEAKALRSAMLAGNSKQDDALSCVIGRF